MLAFVCGRLPSFLRVCTRFVLLRFRPFALRIPGRCFGGFLGCGNVVGAIGWRGAITMTIPMNGKCTMNTSSHLDACLLCVQRVLRCAYLLLNRLQKWMHKQRNNLYSPPNPRCSVSPASPASPASQWRALWLEVCCGTPGAMCDGAC